MLGRNLHDSPSYKNYKVFSPRRNELDLLISSSVNQYLSEIKPDLIIHAAGKVGGIAANMATPYDFLSENLEMGKNLIAASKEHQVPQFLNFSSSCVYPRFGNSPLKEEDILKGELEPTNEGYALAKIAVMRLGEFAMKGSTFQFKSLIPCNLYGRFDHFDPLKSHLLPSIIMKVHDAKSNNKPSIEVWGSGEVRREFMFASDLADITWKCINRFNELPLTMNIGIGRDYTVNEYYQTSAKVLGWEGEFIHDKTKPEGMKQKLVDNSRMTQMGLKSQTSLEEGIRRTYSYYLKTLENI